MITIENKQNCTGCGACAQACPVGCIAMRADEEGFLYPAPDADRCVSCGKCEKVCPVSHARFAAREGFPEGYLVYDRDEKWRLMAAGGGGFAGIARDFLKKTRGVVFGARFDPSDRSRVLHARAEDEEGLKPLLKSKYVQSDTGDTFSRVRALLKEGRAVLYSGTPCQIQGLRAYLGPDREAPGLYTVDLSCHGAPSPRVFGEYLKYLEAKEKSPLISFTMRDKRPGNGLYLQGFGMTFKNGHQAFVPHKKDVFGRCFWGEIASRPSCYQCPFKTVWRAADVTLGDCWFLNSFVPGEQDSLGVTMALVHTDKGKKLVAENALLRRFPVASEKLILANGGMIYQSAVPHPSRAVFFSRLGREPLDRLADELVPVKKQRLRARLADRLNESGLRLEFLRKKSRAGRLKERLNRTIPERALGEMVFPAERE